jgi:zinc protease
MTDLSAASLTDVEGFFKRFYVPNNAVIVVAGDVQPERVRDSVERLFGWIPRGTPVSKPSVPIPPIANTRYITLEDRVTLPQLNIAWRSTAAYAPGDAALAALSSILTDGKTSRLYSRLVYEERVAQDVLGANEDQTQG